MTFAQEIFDGAKVFLIHRQVLLELRPIVHLSRIAPVSRGDAVGKEKGRKGLRERQLIEPYRAYFLKLILESYNRIGISWAGRAMR